MKCNSCQREWLETSGVVDTNCPFCQAEIKVVDTRTDEEKMVFIVEKFQVDLYESPVDFCAVIDEVFEDTKICGLLTILVANFASIDVLELKDLPTDQLKQPYENLITQLEEKTYILPKTIIPAINLLFYGLGVDLSNKKLGSNLTNKLPETPIYDFEIENGVLKKYLGYDSEIVIPSGVVAIGVDAFKVERNQNVNSEITKITLPSTVKAIAAGAFYECRNLTEIFIPDSVTAISGKAFYYCENLREITIPDSITYIGDCAFYNCGTLTKMVEEEEFCEIVLEEMPIEELNTEELCNLPQETIDKIKSINPNAFNS